MPDNNDGYVGYLTADQFTRLEWAVHHTAKLVPWLRIAGYIRTGDTDIRVQATSDRPLGLPPTWIAAEEINSLIGELNQWPELADAASDNYGAHIAVMLTREVETARAKWPYEDRPHTIRHMRCDRCDGLTLQYRPPRHEGDDIQVRCKTRECGAEMGGEDFALAADLIRRETDERQSA